ncbi:hypothetical protein BJV74DRAFT_799901 [Russula compacta]|nr:hypothetical protein BJV74DRAFT_799901 [Russula compacta]
MSTLYEVWYHNPLLVMESQIGNHDYRNEMDYAPKQVFSQTWTWQFCDLMLGDWAWEQADIIAKDSEAHGAMFAPMILGSDKTTVSVTMVVGFLAIPKSTLYMELVHTLQTILNKHSLPALFYAGVLRKHIQTTSGPVERIWGITWVMDYVAAEHGTKDTNQILDDIDHVLLQFLHLQDCKFPEGWVQTVDW